MTRDEALELASTTLSQENPNSLRARVLVEYAAEVRAGTAPGKRLPPEDPTTRLTLHDVEAGLCTKHAALNAWRIQIRDRRTPTAWWMHADDQSTCA